MTSFVINLPKSFFHIRILNRKRGQHWMYFSKPSFNDTHCTTAAKWPSSLSKCYISSIRFYSLTNGSGGAKKSTTWITFHSFHQMASHMIRVQTSWKYLAFFVHKNQKSNVVSILCNDFLNHFPGSPFIIDAPYYWGQK